MSVKLAVNGPDDLKSSLPWGYAALILLAAVVGALAAAVILPAWLPNVADSLLGSAPKAYWYLSRTSAFVAYGLLWVSMMTGVIITNKMARVWPGGPTAYDLHEYTSVLGLAFAPFHGLILMGDQYIAYTLAQVLTPFASVNYRPGWVGVGQIGLYIFGLVTLSFYVRRWLGYRSWRIIHFLSFVMFAMAMVHGVWSGTDTSSVWVQAMYWLTGGSFIFFTLYRVLGVKLSV